MGRIIQYNEITRNASQARYPHLWQGLVGAWYPSLGIQGRQLLDVSGHGNNGTLVADTHYIVDKYGYVLDFDGTADSISISNNLTSITTGSVKCTAKIDTDNRGMLWSKYINGDNLIVLEYNSATDKIEFDFWFEGARRTQLVGPVVSLGVWYDVVLTWDTSAICLYVDGVLVASDTAVTYWPSDISANDVFGTFGGGSRDLDGKMSRMVIYNRALTPSEIQLLYRTDGNALLQRRPSALFKAPAAGGTILPQITSVYMRASA